MRKPILSFLLNITLFVHSTYAYHCHHANEWNAFIPVRIEEDKVYLLLKKNQMPATDLVPAQTKWIPLLGEYHYLSVNKPLKLQFLKEKIKDLVQLDPTVDLKAYFKETTAFSYQHSVADRNYSGSGSYRIENNSGGDPFFNLPKKDFEERQTLYLISPFYKIYYVPVYQKDYSSTLGKDLQWFSVEEIKNSPPLETVSPFEKMLHERCTQSEEEKKEEDKKYGFMSNLLHIKELKEHYAKFPSSPIKI